MAERDDLDLTKIKQDLNAGLSSLRETVAQQINDIKQDQSDARHLFAEELVKLRYDLSSKIQESYHKGNSELVKMVGDVSQDLHSCQIVSTKTIEDAITKVKTANAEKVSGLKEEIMGVIRAKAKTYTVVITIVLSIIAGLATFAQNTESKLDSFKDATQTELTAFRSDIRKEISLFRDDVTNTISTRLSDMEKAILRIEILLDTNKNNKKNNGG